MSAATTFRVGRRAAMVAALVLAVPLGMGCSPERNDPTDVELGRTALVVVLNPSLNEANQAGVPAPGAQRAGVRVSLDGGPTADTDARGVAVLRDLAAGSRVLTLSAGGAETQVPLTLVEGELRELALSFDGTGARVMADVRYPFGGQEVVEIAPGTPAAEVAAALNASNRIVLIRGGTYTGDIRFNGSNVTLFGEGALGGRVVLQGNIDVNGSSNRIRGAHVLGNLKVNGSAFGLTFSRIDGALAVDGSDAVLLHNRLCAGTALSTGNATVLGNEGLAPVPVPEGGC